jgi:hypothetical protein
MKAAAAWLLALIALAGLATYAGHVGARRVERALAAKCIASGEPRAVCFERYSVTP